MRTKPIRLAILDMYDGAPNQGMRCIKEIVNQFEEDLEWQVFDVRGKAEIPDLSFDIFIFTGGPGSPFDGDDFWDKRFFDFLQKLWEHNLRPGESKKFGFFICHSFQMACRHFQIGEVTKRRSKSFGTFPVDKTSAGKNERLFELLDDPFWVADFRDWQVVQPNGKRLTELGAFILAKEKKRPDVPLERAIMAVRFSDVLFGVQFHPEADSNGMLEHFSHPDQREKVKMEHGEEKYHQMIRDLKDPDKIELTRNTILPSFLKNALEVLSEVEA